MNLPGYSNVAYAGINALIIAGGGLLSMYGGSWLGNLWSPHDPRATCWIGLIGAFVSIPLVLLVLFAGNFFFSMICFLLLVLLSESWFAPTIGLVQKSIR